MGAEDRNTLLLSMTASGIKEQNSAAGLVALSEEEKASGRPHFASARLDREWRTMAAMVELYCSGKHGTRNGVCAECEPLLNYATVRLERCQFGAAKPTCANCPVHCYAPKRREEMKAVMRYAGPRMLWHHPILTVRHWLDGRAGAPERKTG